MQRRFLISLERVRFRSLSALSPRSPDHLPLFDSARVLISIPLQYIEIIGNPDLLGADDPWSLEGSFIHRQQDLEAIKELPLHSITWYIFSLRLAICFNAGKEVTAKIVEDGERFRDGAGGLIYTQEWLFLSSLFCEFALLQPLGFSLLTLVFFLLNSDARHGLPESHGLVEENIARLSRFQSE